MHITVQVSGFLGQPMDNVSCMQSTLVPKCGSTSYDHSEDQCGGNEATYDVADPGYVASVPSDPNSGSDSETQENYCRKDD